MAEIIEKKRIQIGPYAIDVHGTFDLGKRPLLFIHGIGVSGRYFIPLAQELAAHFDVYVLDLPGYGKTPRPDHALTIEELADIVGRFVEISGVVDPVLIGQSMGCQVAVKAAVSHQPLYSNLILFGPTVNRNERTLPWQVWRLLQDGFSEPLAMNRIMIEDYLRMGLLRYLKTTRSMLAYKIEDDIGQCDVPITIIRGAQDRISPHAWVTYLGKICQRGTVHEILDGPHNIHFTDAKKAAKICQDFLN